MGMLHVCYRSFLFMRIDCKYMTYCIHILRTLNTYFLVVKGKNLTLTSYLSDLVNSLGSIMKLIFLSCEKTIQNISYEICILWRCRRRWGGASEDSGCGGGCGDGGQSFHSVDSRHVAPSGGQRRLGGDNHVVD